jgi:hypothetical protein
MKSLVLIALVILSLVQVTGCGGGSSGSSSPPPSNPFPSISSLSPSSTTTGGAAFTLTVNGTNFISTSTAQWNGTSLATTFVSATQLTAAVTATNISAAGTANVTVTNPSPGGGTSTATSFAINNPAPAISSLSPASVLQGGSSFTLTVSGSDFVSSSTVQWNGASLTTTFVSVTQLTATVAASDIAAAGTASVTVVNPAPGGGTSPAQTFTTNYPAPSVTSVSPSSATAGGAAFTLTVNGSNFVSGSTVQWNGSNRTTSYVSATQLTAAITAADVATTGTASVTVVNPTPGGGPSQALTFTIAIPAPTVSLSLNPATVEVGSSAMLSWSSTNSTSCTGVGAWSGAQATSGSQSVSQASAGTDTWTLTCINASGSASASTTLITTGVPGANLTVEGMTGLPGDISPLLSIAGKWQPVASQYITSQFNGGIVGPYEDNIVLPNGLEGIVTTGWANDPGNTTFMPEDISILQQQADGTLQEATSTYVSDPQTNGGTSVVVADFNGDGVQDIYLAPYNETPAQPTNTIVYLSNPAGTYDKIELNDQLNAQDAELAMVNGVPTVFTGSYYTTSSNADTVSTYNGSGGFTENPNTGVGGTTSVATADFYGNGTYSTVYGDFKYGPNYPYSSTEIFGIYLYSLSNLLPTGDAIDVGNPYFDTPAYAGYSSFLDPNGKQSSFRIRTDDFNHDGMLDILVEGEIWNSSQGFLKTIVQMFQNNGNYQFTDVTDSKFSGYDKNCTQPDAVPQVRDIDASGINSYLFATGSYPSQAPCTYVVVNDGTGNLQPALYQTLYTYGQQVNDWLVGGGSGNQAVAFPGYFVDTTWIPTIRAYQTPNGLLNFVAIVGGGQNPNSNGIAPETFFFVNIPLQLDITTQYVNPIVVTNRNGSHLIRTFAGNDTIYSGNDGGYATVDGGGGTNTVVYSGSSKNYTITQNSNGTWTVLDNVGKDGTDTLTRIQLLQFTDTVMTLK